MVKSNNFYCNVYKEGEAFIEESFWGRSITINLAVPSLLVIDCTVGRDTEVFHCRYDLHQSILGAPAPGITVGSAAMKSEQDDVIRLMEVSQDAEEPDEPSLVEGRVRWMDGDGRKTMMPWQLRWCLGHGTDPEHPSADNTRRNQGSKVPRCRWCGCRHLGPDRWKQSRWNRRHRWRADGVERHHSYMEAVVKERLVFSGAHSLLRRKWNSAEEPKSGDLIEISRGLYEHWAIYIGDGYVIHLVLLSEHADAGVNSVKSVLHNKAEVKKGKLKDVVGEDQYRIHNLLDEQFEPHPTEDILRDAGSLVGNILQYNVFTRNCEHFVTLLRYGKPQSQQSSSPEDSGLILPSADHVYLKSSRDPLDFRKFQVRKLKRYVHIDIL
uniref:LRAT domain-containing protein n=1 Tax=Cyprinus carpio TaxID=7962 RepID=A0A8C1VC28_CYPCA